jgi:hypothetical protein
MWGKRWWDTESESEWAWMWGNESECEWAQRWERRLEVHRIHTCLLHMLYNSAALSLVGTGRGHTVGRIQHRSIDPLRNRLCHVWAMLWAQWWGSLLVLL